jgi:DNA-binding FadR family transcriptional regulator
MPRIDNPIEPVRRLKISDSVAAQLELLITQGVYEVGERLPAERELAERFGVGRSTMREALRLVEAEGMLRIDHGVGVFVIRDSKRPEHGRGLLLVGKYSKQVIGLPGRREKAHAGHRAIVAAIVGRKPASARKAVSEHLRETESDLIAFRDDRTP